MDLERYLARVTADDLGAALQTWTWLYTERYQAIGVTAFGDILLVSERKEIFLLDVSFGVLERLARSAEDFHRRLGDERFANLLLRAPLADEAMAILGPLLPHCVYGFLVPLIAGGPATIGNLVQMPMRTSLGMLQPLIELTSTMQAGTRFAIDFSDFPEALKERLDHVEQPFCRARRDRPSLSPAEA